MSRYSKIVNQPVPQKVQLHAGQVKNAAGGWGVEVDCWQQLQRFLILGSTGGNYYFSERDLTRQNLDQVLLCIKQDGKRVVDEIIKVDVAGRAPKKSPAVFALALVMVHGSDEARSYAYGAVNRVCRTGSHLFELLSEADGLKKGWGRGFKRAVAEWFTSKTDDQLAYQFIKYRQRSGYSVRDVLRLSHVKSSSPILRWAAGKGQAEHPQILAFEALQGLTGMKAAQQIIDYRLPWEAVPSTLLGDKDVWRALLQSMPLTAMIRNLGKISSLGLMEEMEVRGKVLAQLNNQEVINRARVHPLTLLVGGKVYASGHGVKGNLTWKANQQVVQALGNAVTMSFGALPKSDHPSLVAVDTSGSMHVALRDYGNIFLHEVCTCMMMAHAAMNPGTQFVMFTTQWKDINVLGRRYDDILKSLGGFSGGTDLNQSVYAAEKLGADAKLITMYTDNETWAGREHCDQAWDKYLTQQPTAKLVVASMTANRIAAHSRHPSVLQAVGFDTSLPQVVNAWADNGVVTDNTEL